MSKNIKSILIIAVTFIAILGISYIYIFDPFIELVLDTPTGMGDFRDKGYYKINPKTILSSLDDGKINVFDVEIATPESPIFEEPISWRQSDYMKVASALHQFVWNEALDDWSLYYMNFSTTCHDNLDGFGLGDFYYFKTILRDDGKIRYTVRGLQITPQYGDTTWGGRITFPRSLSGWKRVNLVGIKFTAEDALQIADKNGGMDARLAVQNQCKIDVGLSGYTDWEVNIYDYKNGTSIFRMEIDPYTGEIK